MQVISGKHRGHSATLEDFRDNQMTAYCQTCRRHNVTLKPTFVILLDSERPRMEQSLKDHAAGARRTGEFWTNWKMTENGIFIPRKD